AVKDGRAANMKPPEFGCGTAQAGESVAKKLSRLSGGRGQLLGHAVDGAKAQDQIAAVDADDFAVRQKFRQGVERDPVVGIVEYRHEDNSVGDVEISVAGRQALAVEKDRRGHGECLDSQRLTVLILHGLKKR